MPPALPRALAVGATAAVAVLAAALPASAHVSVSSPDATPGGELGTLIFRVPSESPKALTTKVSVALPAATPFAFVSAKPIPGWSVATTERKLDKPIKAEGFTLTKAVSTVTWTASRGQGLKPGEFDEFELSVGPFPDKVSSLALPATQTYSDGQVVHWNQPTPAGGKEPESPAPTLDLAAAKSGDPASGADDSDGLARWLGGGGLLLGAAALVVAVASRRRPVSPAGQPA